MSLTFSLEFRTPDANGSLTDATGTPTIGIIRTDTSAVVVASGTAMTHDGTGLYSYTIASPVAGVTYRGTWHAVVDGETLDDSYDLTAADVGWHYADYTAVSDLISQSNLAIIDDPDNDGTENTDLVQRCGEWSDAIIDARLGAFGFTTPLANTDSATDLILRDISAKLTIAQLNRSRGLIVVSRGGQNINVADKMMGVLEREAYSMLVSIGSGWVKITADRGGTSPTGAVPAFTTYVAPTLDYSPTT